MKKILIMSDTHGRTDNILEVIELEKPDFVIHAGDYCVPVEFIKNNTDYFVCGNNDFDGNEIEIFTIEGIKFFLTHSDAYFFDRNNKIYKEAKKIDASIAIVGHTHVEQIEWIDDLLIINPGSLSFPRNLSRTKTYAILLVENKKVIDCIIKQYNNN